MAQEHIQILGLERLMAGLDAAPAELREAARLAMRDSLLLVEAEVKTRTPRVTGRLQAAWTPRDATFGGHLAGVVGNKVHYGPFVEGGTRRMSGRHMARDAKVASMPRVIARFRLAVETVFGAIKGI